MELEEMKSLWQNLSIQVEKQEKIQKELLMEITKKRYKSKIDGIRTPEIIGTVICYAYAVYLAYNFGQIELWFNQLFAVFNILLFVLIPLASMRAIYRLSTLEVNHLATTEMLARFQEARKSFWRVQQRATILSGIVILTMVPVLGDIQGKLGKFMSPEFWMIFVPLGLGFVYFFSRFVLRKYKTLMDQSEEILQGV